MSSRIHPKHSTDFLISPARDVREQHPWEARGRHEGHFLPGLWGSGACTIGAHATSAPTVPGPTTSNEWCLTKATVETLCYVPPKLLANSRKTYWNWSKVGKSVIYQLQLAKISSFMPLDGTTYKCCAVAFVQPWLIDRWMPLNESPAALSAVPNKVAHPNID